MCVGLQVTMSFVRVVHKLQQNGLDQLNRCIVGNDALQEEQNQNEKFVIQWSLEHRYLERFGPIKVGDSGSSVYWANMFYYMVFTLFMTQFFGTKSKQICESKLLIRQY